MTAPAWRARLARELADEALFDSGVEAARNACVAGASIAAAAITAAAFYDNPMTGIPAVRALMGVLAELPFEAGAWCEALRGRPHPETGDPAFTPGFGFIGEAGARAVVAACARLGDADAGAGARAAFFLAQRAAITAAAGPLNQAGLAALAFADGGADVDEAERLFLAWRVETAVAEAQRARRRGLAAFPFFTAEYAYEGPPRPPARALDLDELMQRVGLA